ncbi:hypothetical protein KP22_06640 [Pectobacterium betavasculorum]|uniref:Uncharacterized protein n=1 Tax=Pectobacterium betavasculorum TaxID=55207 RepID=A0A093SX34_9GAMM|nr:hypothetical protein KP22_06640 [Pectobacterium betavasculorum]KFX19805.1 hypothetical protein JV35_12880 [Pectobacterium betavasculorum]
MNLLKKLPWKTLLWVAAVLLALWLIYQNGYESGFARAESAGHTALEKQKSASDATMARLQADVAQQQQQRAEQHNAALQVWQQRYQQLVMSANAAEQRYLTTTASLRQQNENLKRRIDDVTQHWIDERGQSRPIECVFTAGFVQQYNAAFDALAGTGITTAASGAGYTPAAATPLDARLRDSGVTQRDILAHSTDAGERYQQLAAQVNGLLDYLDTLQDRTK